MRRRAYDSFLVTSGAKEHDLLSKDELNFLQAAEIGDLPTVKQMLENDDLAPKLLRCTDYKDRTALEVSTENEHLEIVEFLVQKGGRKLDIQAIQESLMLAISKGYLRITQALLNHPVHQRSKDKFRLGSLTNYYQRKNNSKFEQDVTPLMLAAHCNEIDIIRLLLNRGDTIKKPHNSLCQCTYCSNKKQFDPLKHSLAGFNTYRALASPAFIALTSPDPILTAFLLSQELASNARIEKEFKNEYRDLARQCKEFASDLLDMCQNSEEVRTILNNEATTLDESEHGRGNNWLKSEVGDEASSRAPTLSRLKLAIKLRQKQFVAHSHCQHELATLWYRNFPSWRLMSLPKKVFVNVLIVLGLPFFTLCYYLAPYSKLGQFVSSPLVKFILYSASYFVFLLVIFIESLYAQTYTNWYHDQKEKRLTSLLRERLNTTTNTCLSIFPGLEKEDYIIQLRFFELTPLEIVILIFLMGFLWGEIKQLWAEGLRAYLASIWNWIDIAMLNLYLASCTLNILSVTRARRAIDFFMTNVNAPCLYKHGDDSVAQAHFYFLQRERSMWHNDDPVFVSEALYALANVLSFSRLSYILPVSEFLGPLQISLGRMLGDILRFAVVFIVVFLAFFCSMFNLYYSYEDSKFGNFGQAFLTLFWALFGLGNPADPRLHHNSTSNATVSMTAGGKGGYLITESFGTMLYMIYYVVMGLVMLNMLIAMMSNSFQEINSEQDVEWKFARAQLWMSYFEKGATIPVPFNIIPSPKSFYHLYKWVVKQLVRCRRGPPSRDSNQVPLGERRNGVFNILNRLELRRDESTHESITKGIIKRYLFKLQRDKENDEVNEGELDEIKNDISSLRFELMEQLRAPKTPSAPLAPSSAPAFTFSFPSATTGSSSTKGTDISHELNALKAKVTELTKHIETLTNATLSQQVVAYNSSTRGSHDRIGHTDLGTRCGSANSLRTLDSDCSRFEYDLQGRRNSSPRVLDIGDIPLSYDDSERQQDVIVRRRNRSGRRTSADSGDTRRESLQRAYDVTDIVGYGDHDKQHNNNNPRQGYGGRGVGHTSDNRRQSKPAQSGRSGMSHEPDKRSISRTLSRGSIHVGFDLETRHDPILRVVDEDATRMDFEPDMSSSHNVIHTAPDMSGGSQSRDFESSKEVGVSYDFDEHHADGGLRSGVRNGNTRARYTQEQDTLGVPTGHYNIAFSLDA
ncbi:short transient receptor potential channel 3-like [Lytechinus variegatus]|uniref:short transient receptor potential channel 3-like n=1 Tax=Lytechinus variegatus TaxID=7654 RepID=UPI001BB10D65|nr:short transient receptor potential channel 3-like [Lytechinus variegatus]